MSSPFQTTWRSSAVASALQRVAARRWGSLRRELGTLGHDCRRSPPWNRRSTTAPAGHHAIWMDGRECEPALSPGCVGPRRFKCEVDVPSLPHGCLVIISSWIGDDQRTPDIHTQDEFVLCPSLLVSLATFSILVQSRSSIPCSNAGKVCSLRNQLRRYIQ